MSRHPRKYERLSYVRLIDTMNYAGHDSVAIARAMVARSSAVPPWIIGYAAPPASPAVTHTGDTCQSTKR